MTYDDKFFGLVHLAGLAKAASDSIVRPSNLRAIPLGGLASFRMMSYMQMI